MNRVSKIFIMAGIVLSLTAFVSFQQTRAAIFEGTETTEGVRYGLCLDNPNVVECEGIDCTSTDGAANPLCISESQVGTGIAKTNLSSTGITHTDNLGDYIKKLVNFALPYLALAAFVGYVVAGFLYVTAFGNEEMMKKARTILVWSTIGLILVILSYAIVNLLTGGLVEALQPQT